MNKTAAFALVISFVSLASVFFIQKPQAVEGAKKETTFERIMRTNTLRCGYIIFPPQFNKDLNTGKFSGIAYDIVETMAQRLNLKIEWSEEVNFSTMNTGLETGRYDALCFSLYRWVPSARAVDYSTSLFCSPTNIYVRKEDDRFDNDIAGLNNAAVSLGVVDGEGANNIAAEDFPKMNIVSMPQNTDLGILIEGLDSKKYDAIFANPLMVSEFDKNNPNKIKNITPNKPIRAYCHSLAFPKGEQTLVNTVNIALEEMLNFGIIDKILKKYEPSPQTFYRINVPWKKE
jgi:polar amino acid transport system substrate-binding protein